MKRKPSYCPGIKVELRSGAPLYFTDDREPVFVDKIKEVQYKVCLLECGMGFKTSKLRKATSGDKSWPMKK